MPLATRRLLAVTLTAALWAVALRPPGAAAQPAFQTPEALAEYVDGALDAAPLADAFWGAYVVNAETGAVLYARNASKNFVPASNAKLYTTAAALDQLGPDFRFETRLFADGPVEEGVLRGNLVVQGAGDPSLGGYEQRRDPAAVFRAWADSLKAAGISFVEGDVVGDDDVLSDTPLGAGWSWDDEPYYYAAESGGLVFNQNAVEFWIEGQAPGAPAQVRWEPFNTGYIEVTNATRTSDWGTSIEEDYARARGTNAIYLGTRVPAGRTERETLTITNGTLYFAHVLREALLRRGIGVDGRAVDVDEMPLKPAYDERFRRLATYTSPPLSEIAASLQKESLNLYAEQLLRTLGARRPVPESALEDEDIEPGSAEMGAAAAQHTFAAAGVDTSALRLADGSGLSRMNLVSPESTVALLRYMRGHPDAAVREAFVEALPVGGVDGTLQRRFQRGAARGNVRAKTGTLTSASALSGYVTTAAGTPLAFALFCNHYTARTSRVRQAQDVVVQALAAYRR